MTVKKAGEAMESQQSLGATKERKPWVKKTPVEVVLDQINRLRDDVTKKEEELKQAKRQLQKLEEARKVLET
jgi:hypothetical protein